MSNISFKQLMEKTAPCPPSSEPITSSEAMELVKRFQKVFNTIGVDFSFSRHGGLYDRLTDTRNKPPISKCEFDHVMSGFVRKMGKQLWDDVKDIEMRKVTPRGKRTENIRANNYEYAVLSRSTGIAIVLALQPNPDRSSKYRVRVNIVTIIRKPGFKVNQGETVMVEGVEYQPMWIIVD